MNIKGLAQKRATACDYAYTLSEYKNEACAYGTRSAYASIRHFTACVQIETGAIGNKSVPIQLAKCWFPGLAISNAKILIYYSNKIYGSNFIKKHTRQLLWFEITEKSD